MKASRPPASIRCGTRFSAGDRAGSRPGVTFRSGTLSFQSALEPQPLSRLEEAMLIAATGITGLPFADNPYETADGQAAARHAAASKARGRAAGSPDNAQSTHFFMWNDEGTYLLKRPDRSGCRRRDVRTMSADELIAHAGTVQGQGQGWPRRFSARVPGLRERQPVRVERAGQHDVHAGHRGDPAVHQRPVLRAGAGARPAAGVRRRLQPVPAVRLREVGEVEVPQQGDPDPPRASTRRGAPNTKSMLLLQNLALVAQSMGLGGWIHAAFEPTILLGGYPGHRTRPRVSASRSPRRRPAPAAVPGRRRRTRWASTACCSRMRRRTSRTPTPPSTRSSRRSTARQVSIATARTAAPSMKPESAAAFVREAPHVEPEVVEVVRAICRYIWKTYRRFPAHCHAIDSAGIWMQCHHIDPEFYDRYFTEAYSPTQAAHAAAWHGAD